MNKNYIANAFSLQMLASADAYIKVSYCRPEDIPADAISAIGHQDTANVVSNILGRTIPANRINICLEPGDVLYVAQLMGGRLPEGSTTLPDGFRIEFRRVEVTA